jgi:hypothetical protein
MAEIQALRKRKKQRNRAWVKIAIGIDFFAHHKSRFLPEVQSA